MKVLIAGDFCPNNKLTKLFDSRNFVAVLGDIKDIVDKTDYSIVNFECPVSNSGNSPIQKTGPNLFCSSSALDAIAWSGFKCVTLANNHFFDYGDEGCHNTISLCKANDIDYVGGGRNFQEAAKTLYKSIGGKVVAVINCCEHEFSIANEHKAGSNPINPIAQYRAIIEAKKQANFIIVIVHGGCEHYNLPSLRMVETYRFFIDVGADAVINHHQHCYSGYELYQGKPIFYGIGNFCFPPFFKSTPESWYEGYMVTLSFGEPRVTFELTPYRQCFNDNKIIPLEKNSFDEKLLRLNEIISNRELLAKELNMYYGSVKNHYSSILEPFYNRWLLAAKRKGLLPSFITEKKRLVAEDYILCESHRDKLQYFFNNPD